MSRADRTLSLIGAALDRAQAKSRFVATAMVPDDDAPSFDDDGYTAMCPSFDEAAMLAAYENPDLSDAYAQLLPQEAYEHMKFQAPLSRGEKSILNSTPFLDDLAWVDDPDRAEWLRSRSKEGSKAMDKVLEDQMYGERRATAFTGLNDDWISRVAGELRRDRARARLARATSLVVGGDGRAGDVFASLRAMRGAR